MHVDNSRYLFRVHVWRLSREKKGLGRLTGAYSSNTQTGSSVPLRGNTAVPFVGTSAGSKSGVNTSRLAMSRVRRGLIYICRHYACSNLARTARAGRDSVGTRVARWTHERSGSTPRPGQFTVFIGIHAQEPFSRAIPPTVSDLVIGITITHSTPRGGKVPPIVAPGSACQWVKLLSSGGPQSGFQAKDSPHSSWRRRATKYDARNVGTDYNLVKLRLVSGSP